MKTKKLSIQLEKIPEILERGVFVINRELELLSNKESLDQEESKIFIQYMQMLQVLHKEYYETAKREISLKKAISELPTQEIMNHIKNEVS